MNRKFVGLSLVMGAAFLIVCSEAVVVWGKAGNNATQQDITPQSNNPYAGIIKALFEAGKSPETQKAFDDAVLAVKNVCHTHMTQVIKKLNTEELEIMRGVVDLAHKEFNELYDPLVIMTKSDATPEQQKAASEKIADRLPGIQMKALTTFVPFLQAFGDVSLVVEVSEHQNMAADMLGIIKSMLNECKDIVHK